MKNLLVLIAILTQLNLFAQHSPKPVAGKALDYGRVFGKITDDQGKAIANVSVRVSLEGVNHSTNSISVIKGTTTQNNGQFNLAELPVDFKYSIKISGIGYEPQEQIVSFSDSKRTEKDLGNIVLKPAIMELQGVAMSK